MTNAQWLIRTHEQARQIIDEVNWEKELKEYIDLWTELQIEQNAGSLKNPSFWSFTGAHRRVDYRINWEDGYQNCIAFYGTDPEGDGHGFEIPYEFFTDIEEKRNQLAQIKEENIRKEEEKARLFAETEIERTRKERLRQYKRLREEFGDDES